MNKTALPNIEAKILIILRSTFSIPFYDKFLGKNYIRNGTFLGVGINRSQLLLIWCENILLFFTYIYLYYFSFNICNYKENISQKKDLISKEIRESSDENENNNYLSDDNNKDNDNLINTQLIIQDEKKKSKNRKFDKELFIYELLKTKDFQEDISKIKENGYKEISQIMEYNFNVEIISFEELNEILLNLKKNDDEKDKKKDNIISEIDISSINSSKNSKYKINISDYLLYFFSHNIILTIILFISMVSPGLLALILLFFCFYFLFFSSMIIEGKKTKFPFIINKVIGVFIIIDIYYQLATQIILIYDHNVITNYNIAKYILNAIGFREFLNEKYEITSNIKYLILKNFCFFLITIQNLIYSSRGFKKFYLSYLIKLKLSHFDIYSIINAHIFNNDRIKEMNDSLKLKIKSQKSLQEVKEKIKRFEEIRTSNDKVDKKSEKIEENIDNTNTINKKKSNKEENNEEENKEEKNNEEKNKEEKNNEEKNNKEENNEEKNNKEENNKEENNKEENNKEENNEEENNKEENNKEENNKEDELNNNTNLSLKSKVSNDDKNDKNKINYENVKNIIREWIESQTFLIKIYSFLDKRAYLLSTSSYVKEGNEKKMINLIKGNIKHTPHILKKIDQQIDILDLSNMVKEKIKSLKEFVKQLYEMEKDKLKTYFLNFINKKDKINLFVNEKDEKDEGEKNEDEKDEKKLIINRKTINQIYKMKFSILFNKYLSTLYLMKKIFKDIIIIIKHDFYWVCYFLMILNHMINSSIISLFYPISIFCYSLMANPRPSKNYWNICYIYTFISLIFKCFIQEIFLERFRDVNDNNGPNPDKTYMIYFMEYYQIGFKLFDNYNEYYFNLSLDYLVLISLIINKNILILNGLWEHDEEYYENIEKATERVYKYNNIIPEEKKDSKKKDPKKKDPKKKDLKKNNFLLKDKTIAKRIKSKHIKKKGYFEILFPKLRNEKPGKDYYYLYTFAMIIIIFYVLIFYTTMVNDKIQDDSNIGVNQFNRMTVIILLIHIFILIIDRVFYLRQNRKNVKYEYISLSEDGILEIIEENKNLKSSNAIIFQKETLNLPLLGKYLLHIVLTIFSHFFIFFYMPISGNYNIYNAAYCIENINTEECNDFQKNIATIFFYILYLIYLTFSALQIKYGFYDLRRANVFKNFKSINEYILILYKLFPYFYPLKNIIDWTFTPTSFGLLKWFQFENIYDKIFLTCKFKNEIDDQSIGKKTEFWKKVIYGGFISNILIFILIDPLIIFSGLNPTNQINNVNSASMKIYMSFVDYNEQEKNILIFENNWAKSITNMTNEVWEEFNYSNSYYTKTFPLEQVQIISFYATPENILSEYKINNILSNIDSLLNLTDDQQKPKKDRFKVCKLKIENDFIRSFPANAREVKKQSELLICNIESNKDSDGCLGLKSLYNYSNKTSQDNSTNVVFNITGFSPIVKLGSTTKPIEIGLEEKLNKTLIFKTKGKDLFEIYFEKIIEDNGIQYHIMNEKASLGIFGHSFIGFYTAIVLAIGPYIAKIFKSNTFSATISKMEHPELLLDICEAIKTSRNLYDFKNEKYYFTCLIEILSKPELLKLLTKSTLKQINEMKKLPE